jgi:amino acid adenylation domain-containing protein
LPTVRSNETSPASADQGALAPARAARTLPDPRAPLHAEQPALIQDAPLARARERPDALALSSRHGACSYGQLEQLSRQIAHHLLSAGVGVGDTVAIYADRNPALVYCLLGVLRAGAVFHLLDVAYPVPRIVACLQQTAPRFVLIAGDVVLPEALLSESALANAARVRRVPADAGEALSSLAADAPSTDAALPMIDAHAIAYVSFTSGSTGAPKGIVTTHGPLPHFITWHCAHGELSASDRFSLLSGLSHDPLLRDIFTPLSLGASLHIPEQTTIFDADALWSWFAEERITVAHMTPAMGEILEAGAPQGAVLASLRRLYWGGDVLKPRLVAAIRQLAPTALQTNFYGATETPQAMAFFDLAELADDAVVPIGRGIADCQLLVVREDRQLAAVGEAGEIWIRSPYLSRGYLADEVGTRERFVANPLTAAADDRCYRTGDLGRYREDGAVLFSGRADHQLKIRGFRVEPAEIVAALERSAGVQRAVVLGIERNGEKQLTAYVVNTRGSALSAPELRSQLTAVLPPYMVPKHFVLLPELPLLPNGKPDLRALPAPSDDATSEAQALGRRLPRNDAERQMAAIWAEILGLSEVGIDESFLDLGGDSLAAIRALSRMRRLGIRDDVARGIFQGRTIAELTDEQAPQRAKHPPLQGAAKVTLLINVLRGLLVLTLVFDHWREGLFKRLPFLPLAFTQGIEPIFHLPTPGFAFVFGIGLGHSHYETYLKNPAASRRLLGGGALLLGIGTVLMALSRNLGVVARGLPLDYDLFFVNFFLPTLYYWMALVTAPLWFSLMARREGRWGGSLLGALGLALASRTLYELCRLLLIEHEQKGLLQLGRLMLTARFSYFNLSTGALLGVFFGLLLRRQRARASLVKPLSQWGGALTAAGLLLYLAQRDSYPLGLLSPDIYVPEWLFYTGVTLLIGAAVELSILYTQRSPVRRVHEWIGVVGQCAMPIFILQGMALDVSAFGRALGLRDSLAVLVSLGSFVLAVGWMMRRIHGLYYGAIPERAGKGEPLASAV